MAMFLSRLKQILNLGTKSITANGTYTASSDGYDGYSEVTVNVPTVTPLNITPSNANPVALSSGVAVEPTANGYAIESYENLYLDPEVTVIDKNKIYKTPSVNLYAVRNYSGASASDSDPPFLSAGQAYFINNLPGSSGYLYANQYNTTPKIFMGGLGSGGNAGYIDIVQDLVEDTNYSRHTSKGTAALGFIYFGRPRNISVTSTQGRWICVHPDNTTTTLAQSITNANVDNVLYMVNSKQSGAALNVKITYR